MTWADVAALAIVAAAFVGIWWATVWGVANTTTRKSTTDRILDGLREPTWRSGDEKP